MKKKSCFGILDNVFPMGKDGLREVVPTCFQCVEKTDCLQSALRTEEGMKFKSEKIDRMPVKGFKGRLKRWSQKKELHRTMTEQESRRNKRWT